MIILINVLMAKWKRRYSIVDGRLSMVDCRWSMGNKRESASKSAKICEKIKDEFLLLENNVGSGFNFNPCSLDFMDKGIFRFKFSR
jgi:hypothetical protein